MEILIEDVMLVDSPKATGGSAFSGETLADFINEWQRPSNYVLTLADLNRELEECGIEPISEEQIIIKGVKQLLTISIQFDNIETEQQ